MLRYLPLRGGGGGSRLALRFWTKKERRCWSKKGNDAMKGGRATHNGRCQYFSIIFLPLPLVSIILDLNNDSCFIFPL